MHIHYIDIKQFFSHIIQRKTQTIFSLYLVFEGKTRCHKKSIVYAFSNISKEYVRSCYFPISIRVIPVKWVLNFDKKNHRKK
jgi:hypothetical protein